MDAMLAGSNVLATVHLLPRARQSLQAASQAGLATLLALAGRTIVPQLRPVQLLQAARRRVLPATRASLVPMRRAITQRPVYAVGTAAVATYAATTTSQAPVAGEVVTVGARMAMGVQSAVKAAATLAEAVGRQASHSTRHTTNLVTGLAGAASRTAGVAVGRIVQSKKGTMGASTPSGPGTPRIALPSLTTQRTQKLALVVASRR
jgi:hypothetical protein